MVQYSNDFRSYKISFTNLAPNNGEIYPNLNLESINNLIILLSICPK